jgi:1,4-dihydroxy-2-naphthoate octaprenyltransferase
VPSDRLQTIDPSPQDFAGDSPGQIAKRLFHATRPRFYPASILPVLVGTSWGFNVSGNFDFFIFMLALLATVCVHAGANVLNDVGDDSGGTDRCNKNRIYPYSGGSRFIQTGIMEAAEMAYLGIGLLAIAATAGLILLLAKGLPILLFGLCGVVLASLYSLGPLRLSAIGLGETAVAVAFGILPVTGSAWLQSGVINADVLLFSVPISAWATAIILINEVPDIDADRATGKRTLPVRLGLVGTANLYIGVQVFAVAAVTLLTIMGLLPLASPLLPIGLLLLAVRSAAAIKRGVEDRVELTRAIESTIAIHTICSLWLCACALFDAVQGT